MNRFLSFVLCLCLCLLSIVATSGAQVEQTGKYYDVFKEYIKETSDDWQEFMQYREIYCHYNTDVCSGDEATPDYVLAFATDSVGQPAEMLKIIGDYAVWVPAYNYPYVLGYHIYVPAEEKIYTIEDAYEAGVDGIEYAFYNLGTHGGLIGDVDFNDKLDVKDATQIQKILAGFEYDSIYYEWLDATIRDFNRDSYFNIKDATAIQKHIAGLEY